MKCCSKCGKELLDEIIIYLKKRWIYLAFAIAVVVIIVISIILVSKGNGKDGQKSQEENISLTVDQEETTGIDVVLPMLETSTSAYLEECYYNKRRYLDDWKSFFEKDNALYDLELTGEEKSYYITDEFMTITDRNDRIVGVSEDGFLSSHITTYRILKEYIDGTEDLVEYEPQMIEGNDKRHIYLKWETENGYIIVETCWWEGLTDWKASYVSSYCMYIK